MKHIDCVSKFCDIDDAPLAAGRFKVKNYRVEELTLPEAVSVEVKGKRVEVSRAFRVTVTGGPFPVHAQPKLEDLHAERFRGIRPALGYPASPDHSEKKELFKLLGTDNIGIALTETMLAWPAEQPLPAVIWIDDEAVGYGVESEDLDAITAVTFDESLVREGATVYLSYGDKEEKKDRTALPEKLKLGTNKGGNQ